jgi:hypothetical protein
VRAILVTVGLAACGAPPAASPPVRAAAIAVHAEPLPSPAIVWRAPIRPEVHAVASIVVGALRTGRCDLVAGLADETMRAACPTLALTWGGELAFCEGDAAEIRCSSRPDGPPVVALELALRGGAVIWTGLRRITASS